MACQKNVSVLKWRGNLPHEQPCLATFNQNPAETHTHTHAHPHMLLSAACKVCLTLSLFLASLFLLHQPHHYHLHAAFTLSLINSFGIHSTLPNLSGRTYRSVCVCVCVPLHGRERHHLHKTSSHFQTQGILMCLQGKDTDEDVTLRHLLIFANLHILRCKAQIIKSHDYRALAFFFVAYVKFIYKNTS